MINKFILSLPENGFGFPCNICAHRDGVVSYCKDCTGYSGPFDADMSDIRYLMEDKTSANNIMGEAKN